MTGIQLPQGYSPKSSGIHFDRPQKDKRLSQPCSHPIILNLGPQNCEFRTLTARPLCHNRWLMKKDH